MERQDLFSVRGQHSYSFSDELDVFYKEFGSNIFHSVTNPEGFVSLGTLMNEITEELIEEKVKELNLSEWRSDYSRYSSDSGIPRLKKAFSNYFTRFFNNTTVSSEHITVISGLKCGIDLLLHAIADPGDVVMVFHPLYSRIHREINLRPQIEHLLVNRTSNLDKGGQHFYDLNMEMVEKTYEKAILKGKRVRAILLINPDNPTGNGYTSTFLKELLKFAKSKSLHVISDEIFARSQINEDAQFQSVLSLEDHCDVDRTHVLYSLSKDFPFAGLRIGAIISRSMTMNVAMTKLNAVMCVPVSTQIIASGILEQTEWLEKTYFPYFHKNLRENFNLLKERFEKMGFIVHKPSFGLSVWINAIKILDGVDEKTMTEAMKKHKVCMIPGRFFYENSPNWFRVTIGCKREKLIEGIKRIENMVEELCQRNV